MFTGGTIWILTHGHVEVQVASCFLFWQAEPVEVKGVFSLWKNPRRADGRCHRRHVGFAFVKARIKPHQPSTPLYPSNCPPKKETKSPTEPHAPNHQNPKAPKPPSQVFRWRPFARKADFPTPQSPNPPRHAPTPPRPHAPPPPTRSLRGQGDSHTNKCLLLAFLEAPGAGHSGCATRSPRWVWVKMKQPGVGPHFSVLNEGCFKLRFYVGYLLFDPHPAGCQLLQTFFFS